jgi:hemolysin activation/secretion protein
MQNDVLKFNAGNDAKARISLEPGPVYGTTNVNVVMDEPQTISAAAFVDNAGQQETGIIRYGAYLAARSLTKYRDILNIGGLITEAGGSHSLFGSYEIPEPFLGTRVGIGADYSDTEITSGLLHSLNVKGDYYDVYLYSKKPFNVKPTTVSNFTFTVTTKRGSNYISSFKTQDTKSDTLSMSVDNLLLFNGGYLFNYVSVTNGLTLIEGDAYFMRYAYQGNLYKTLIKNIAFDFKLKAQYADGTTVPSGNKMQIGGVNTVRGYREGMLSADSGVNAMTELQYDCSNFVFPKILDYTKLFIFFDYGYIFPDSKENIPDNYRKDIYSTGLGVRFSLLKHVESNLTVGRTLAKHTYFENDETKLMFFVQGKI